MRQMNVQFTFRHSPILTLSFYHISGTTSKGATKLSITGYSASLAGVPIQVMAVTGLTKQVWYLLGTRWRGR